MSAPVALDPGRRKQEPPSRTFAKALLCLGVACYVIIYFVWVWMEISLPGRCEASDAISDARSVVENGPAGKTFGLKIIDIRNAREISRSDKELECAATVKLNNGIDGEFRYRFNIDNGQAFVYAQLPSPIAVAEPQSLCAVKLAQYQQLEIGMPYLAARQILACDGTEMFRSDTAGYAFVMYAWRGSAAGADMNATFRNGRLINKAQFGLK
jgi:hypothetical protein